MAKAASDKKGIDIVTINMRKISGVCDRFVISSGTSTTHVRAIADNIIRKLKDSGAKLKHIEGEREGAWILIDFGDVVGHVFQEETRKRYDLEKLWSGAPQERFIEAARPVAAGKKKAAISKKAKRSVRKTVKSSVSRKSKSSKKPFRKIFKKAKRANKKKSK